jgi:hypothetical protein
VDWYLESGIIEPGGGVARYHYADRGENAAVSHEITGYAVSSLLDLYQETGAEGALRQAVESGEYLANGAWHAGLGAMPYEALDEEDRGQTYFFDCGIIARALVRLGRVTGRELFVHRAEQIARSMRRFETAEGAHPIIELPDWRPREYGDRWSQRPGCYHLKSAVAWVEVGGRENMAAFRRMLGFALKDGATFLPGAGDPQQVMDRLHAFGYYLAGLLFEHDCVECRDAIEHGIEQAGGWLREVRGDFERADVCAQLLQVRLWAHHLALVKLDERAAEEEAHWIGRYLPNPGPSMAGGFWFGSRNGELLPYVNPVTHAFCGQALLMWRRHKQGEVLENYGDLV